MLLHKKAYVLHPFNSLLGLLPKKVKRSPLPKNLDEQPRTLQKYIAPDAFTFSQQFSPFFFTVGH